MFFSTSFFVVVSFLASSAFSATISSSGQNTVLVVDTHIKWDQGKIFYADGSLAVETTYVGKNVTFNETGGFISTIHRLPKNCSSNSYVYDSHHVVFTLFEKGQFGPWAWNWRRSTVDETAFVWRPSVAGSAGKDTVAGAVSLDTDPNQQTHNAEIKEGQPPEGFPSNIIPSSSTVWTITIYNDANPHILPPQIYEMVELIYILAKRHKNCGTRPAV